MRQTTLDAEPLCEGEVSVEDARANQESRYVLILLKTGSWWFWGFLKFTLLCLSFVYTYVDWFWLCIIVFVVCHHVDCELWYRPVQCEMVSMRWFHVQHMNAALICCILTVWLLWNIIASIFIYFLNSLRPTYLDFYIFHVIMYNWYVHNCLQRICVVLFRQLGLITRLFNSINIDNLLFWSLGVLRETHLYYI